MKCAECGFIHSHSGGAVKFEMGERGLEAVDDAAHPQYLAPLWWRFLLTVVISVAFILDAVIDNQIIVYVRDGALWATAITVALELYAELWIRSRP